MFCLLPLKGLRGATLTPIVWNSVAAGSSPSFYVWIGRHSAFAGKVLRFAVQDVGLWTTRRL